MHKNELWTRLEFLFKPFLGSKIHSCRIECPFNVEISWLLSLALLPSSSPAYFLLALFHGTTTHGCHANRGGYVSGFRKNVTKIDSECKIKSGIYKSVN